MLQAASWRAWRPRDAGRPRLRALSPRPVGRPVAARVAYSFPLSFILARRLARATCWLPHRAWQPPGRSLPPRLYYVNCPAPVAFVRRLRLVPADATLRQAVCARVSSSRIWWSCACTPGNALYTVPTWIEQYTCEDAFLLTFNVNLAGLLC